MTNLSHQIVQNRWNYWKNVLRDGVMSYGDYVEQVMYLLQHGFQRKL